MRLEVEARVSRVGGVDDARGRGGYGHRQEATMDSATLPAISQTGRYVAMDFVARRVQRAKTLAHGSRCMHNPIRFASDRSLIAQAKKEMTRADFRP
jgi:hypothetical protein